VRGRIRSWGLLGLLGDLDKNMKWRIRGEEREERGGREREKDFSMPSARASHLSSPYSSFIHSVIFPV